jgi:hypothetical protein
LIIFVEEQKATQTLETDGTHKVRGTDRGVIVGQTQAEFSDDTLNKTAAPVKRFIFFVFVSRWSF